MTTPLDRRMRRIIYWTWPFVMLLAGLGVGALLEYNHINSVVDSYARDASSANCKVLVSSRAEGRARADALLTLKGAVVKFSGDAADRRAESKLPADQRAAQNYRTVEHKVANIKVKKLPLLHCVNNQAIPIREGS